jgi:uncharacterized protein (DUF433 family)/DNA-binding transcriptional MerR regulator
MPTDTLNPYQPRAPERVGVFPPRRAGALAGVSGYQIGQWARYGLIRPTVYEGRPTNLYAFNDVAEAIVVHWLRVHGFPYEEIHEAIEAARREHPHWPLARGKLGVARLTVDAAFDRGVIAQQQPDGSYVDIGRPGEQGLLKPEFFDVASDMLRAGGWLAHYLELDRIEVDPRKLGGVPTLEGSRWPVERVARIAADEEGRAVLRSDYDLEERDIDQAVKWTRAAERLTRVAHRSR